MYISHKPTARAMDRSCSLMNHNPLRTAPIRFMRNGAAQVAESSSATETRRMSETWVDVKPRVSRYVVIWLAKDNTVRYKRDKAREARNAGLCV